MRTFWSTQNEQGYSAALLTDFDLAHVIRPALNIRASVPALRLSHAAALLPLRDARTAGAFAVLHRQSTNVRIEVGGREFPGPIRR